MMPDPIIEELHRLRAEIAAQFNYDVFAIGAALQAKQKIEDRPVVSFSAQQSKAEDQPANEQIEQAA
jgi:hypothetical protein